MRNRIATAVACAALLVAGACSSPSEVPEPVVSAGIAFGEEVALNPSAKARNERIRGAQRQIIESISMTIASAQMGQAAEVVIDFVA